MKSHFIAGNIISIVVSAFGIVGGLWLACTFTYTFPLALLPAFIAVVWGSFNLGYMVNAIIGNKGFSFTPRQRKDFNSSSGSTLIGCIAIISIGSAGKYYAEYIEAFKNNELLLHGKKTKAMVYDISKRRGDRYIKYYYTHNGIQHEDKCESYKRNVGDTILVIYSTQIPEINRPIYLSTPR